MFHTHTLTLRNTPNGEHEMRWGEYRHDVFMCNSRLQIVHSFASTSSAWHDQDWNEDADNVGKVVLGLAACHDDEKHWWGSKLSLRRWGTQWHDETTASKTDLQRLPAGSCPDTPNLQVRFHVLTSKVFVGSGLEVGPRAPCKFMLVAVPFDSGLLTHNKPLGHNFRWSPVLGCNCS